MIDQRWTDDDPVITQYRAPGHPLAMQNDCSVNYSWQSKWEQVERQIMNKTK